MDANNQPREAEKTRWVRASALIRASAVAYLGGKCAICGSNEGLQIDHIFDDGKQDRAVLRKEERNSWILCTIWSHLYVQVLCKAHNMAKDRQHRPIGSAGAEVRDFVDHPPEEHLKALEMIHKHFDIASTMKR